MKIERTRIHFFSEVLVCCRRPWILRSLILGKTWGAAHSSATQVTEINTLDEITGNVIVVSRIHIPQKALMIP